MSLWTSKAYTYDFHGNSLVGLYHAQECVVCGMRTQWRYLEANKGEAKPMCSHGCLNTYKTPESITSLY